MPETPFWEDVEVGHELPAIVKRPSTRRLAMYAGASGDFYEVHYDWMGPDGVLRKIAVRYRGTDVPGDDLTCSGRVTKVYERDGARLVDCALTLENSGGEQTTTGTATVQLPSRGG